MSLLLLDTTFLIDADRGGLDLDETIDDQDDVAIAAVTVAELIVGVRLASREQRQTRAALVDEIVESIPVITYDSAVAREHAELLVAVRQQGRPRGAHDLLIAATARATNRAVVSADKEAFSDLPGVATIGHR
jgi:tRNA(fMet)-specific endonuclease VapC